LGSAAEETAMTDLTEAGLTKALKEIQQMLEQPDETITLKPTKLLIQPAALAELGLTVDDVKKMIKENQ
jgi:hydrogenase maturation factor